MPQISSLTQFLKTKVFIFLAFLVFILILGSLYIADKEFRIRNVTLEPENKRNANVRGIQTLKGEFIWFVDEEETATFIKSRNEYIKEVVVTKQYPDSLKLRINYYSPLAVLKVADGYFLLGDEAVILEKSREPISSSLPQITYYQNIPFANNQVGQQLNFQDLKDSLFYLQKLAAMKTSINSIDIKGFHMLGLYTSNQEYIFTAEKERDQQIYQLEATIREFMISGRKINSLDVRFDKPVVVLEVM